MLSPIPQLCWLGHRAARDRSTLRTAAILIEWRYGVDERRRQPAWEGLVATVRKYGSHDWSLGVGWEPARSLSQLDPLDDVELEGNRNHAEAVRASATSPAAAAWVVPGATLPDPCWLDQRSSTDLRAPRTPAILIDHRSNVDHRGRPLEEGLLAIVKIGTTGRWSLDVSWQRSSSIKPIDPLADAELEANRRAAGAVRHV